MNLFKSEWNGFEKIDFEYRGRKAHLVCPHEPSENKKWLYKIEYFGFFPEFEIDMLNRGYYVATIDNESRWCTETDFDVHSEFCKYIINNFELNPKCMTVGMSCGGMQSVYFAIKNPEHVAAMYLDAPVMNFLSCPYSLGKAGLSLEERNRMISEFESAKKLTLSEVINYREHPIDLKRELLLTEIPIIIVSGDSDTVVPYDENGKLLTDYFKENGGNIIEIIKKGGDHHPHSLKDNTPIIEFAKKYY